MLILKVISPWFSIDKDNDETNFPPEVCLLPHSDSVHTPHLHLVHPVDVVDAGVEKDDANLTSEVGLELPEETAAVEAIQGGFRGTASPDLAWCASTSSCKLLQTAWLKQCLELMRLMIIHFKRFS